MSPSYYQRQRRRRQKRAMAGVRGRERKRLAFDPDREGWRVVRTFLGRLWAAPDGRHVALLLDGRTFRCGSARAVLGALAQTLYRKR